MTPGSVRRGSVFLGAGGKQKRRHKDDDNDGNDEERGSNVHGAGSYPLEYQNLGTRRESRLGKEPPYFERAGL